jgi:hypothetical protein
MVAVQYVMLKMHKNMSPDVNHLPGGVSVCVSPYPTVDSVMTVI